MAGNTFGRILRLTTFGESHGPGLGGVLDGCPAGLELCEADMQAELDLRKPGQGPTATKRKESDTVRLLSGVFEGRTTGTPIGFYIANEDQRSRDMRTGAIFRNTTASATIAAAGAPRAGRRPRAWRAASSPKKFWPARTSVYRRPAWNWAALPCPPGTLTWSTL